MKIHHQYFLFVATSAIALLAITSCSKGPDEKPAASESSKRTILIGFIGKSMSNDVFQAAQSGAKEAAESLGAKYGVNIDLEIRTPNDEDATKQAEAIEAITRRGADGIAISCSEANTVTPSIDKAVSRGVPVVCFDSDAPESKRFAFYGADDQAAGGTLMKELVSIMEGKGTVAILGGNQSAPNLQSRIAGAKNELAKHPSMKLNEPSVFYHVETPEKAAEAVQSAQNVNPGIQGWCFVGGWPLFTDDALKWPPGSVKVVSCDALPAELNYLRSGHVQALYAQDCYGWGTKSVELLVEKILSNRTPEAVRVFDPLTKVTKDNVDDYAKNWSRWLGED